jgi:hypothetical protein
VRNSLFENLPDAPQDDDVFRGFREIFAPEEEGPSAPRLESTKTVDPIGGFWDAEWGIPRKTEHRSNHASWHGKFFATREGPFEELLEPQGYVGEEYGAPTRPGQDDNLVIPGHAWNCKCSMHGVYDLKDVPDDYLTRRGRRLARKRR